MTLSPDTIIDLPVESVALVVLQDLHEHGELVRQRWFNEARSLLGTGTHIDILIEAWGWLLAKALIAENPFSSQEAVILTRAGRDAVSQSSLEQIIASEKLGLDLHASLAGKIRPIFLLGDYETSEFKAMKEIEVRVRRLAGCPDELIGVDLMRKAFNPSTGPLADPSHEAGEKQARSDLFAGTIGSFNNPNSHRQVYYNDPNEASEVVLLADLLMRLLDAIEKRLNPKYA